MVKDKLKVILLQMDPVWEDASANVKKIDALLSATAVDADLILLPEMFSTGFTMNTSYAETIDGKTIKWLKQAAILRNTAIAGSISFSENGSYYNRLIWCNPEGEVFYYNKRHLFRMSEENAYFTAGNKIITIDCKGWKIRPFICYDLRFPVWSRNQENAYDVMINFANWPAARSETFITLLKARAIENQCYSIGINRVGRDGNNVTYSGDSLVVDPKGKCLLGPLPAEESSESILLDYYDLINFRKSFPAWKDMDDFRIMTD